MAEKKVETGDELPRALPKKKKKEEKKLFYNATRGWVPCGMESGTTHRQGLVLGCTVVETVGAHSEYVQVVLGLGTFPTCPESTYTPLFHPAEDYCERSRQNSNNKQLRHIYLCC